MIMRVKLDCPSCVAKVYAAVGWFIGNDGGPSSLLRVEASSVDNDEIGVITAWDVHPTPEQVAEFRSVWDATTGLVGVTIIHDAPSSLVDRPNVAAWN
jgi:pantothenate kinase-related protein Tda10